MVHETWSGFAMIQTGRSTLAATSSRTGFPVGVIILSRGKFLVVAAQEVEKAGRLRSRRLGASCY